MTSQGTPQGRFSRAIRDRHFHRAGMAAYELDNVTLANALELSILAAEVRYERWPKLAARWHSRFVDETSGIGAAESALCLPRPAPWADRFRSSRRNLSAARPSAPAGTGVEKDQRTGSAQCARPLVEWSLRRVGHPPFPALGGRA
jgi:hypothetical protein